MNVVTKDEFLLKKSYYCNKIKKGAVFIYPTDTIYGIGGNALDDDVVKRIRTIKNRTERPFSVIAPSRAWLNGECSITPGYDEWVKKLPGPYTLILPSGCRGLSKEVTRGLPTLGVRIPKHWFSKVVEELGFPIITTSANITGEYFMTTLDDMNPKLSGLVDFIVYEGPLPGKPSKIIDLTGMKPKVLER